MRVALSNPNQTNRLKLGHIAGAHGVRGDVILVSYTATPAAIADYGPLQSQDGATIQITRLKPIAKGFAATLKGVCARPAAEALKGTVLYAERAALPATGDDEWYAADLEGMDVVLRNGAAFGSVAGLQNFGAGDLLEIRLPGQKSTVFLPFTLESVPEIDAENARIVIAPPPGWFDSNDETGK